MRIFLLQMNINIFFLNILFPSLSTIGQKIVKLSVLGFVKLIFFVKNLKIKCIKILFWHKYQLFRKKTRKITPKALMQMLFLKNSAIYDDDIYIFRILSLRAFRKLPYYSSFGEGH